MHLLFEINRFCCNKIIPYSPSIVRNDIAAPSRVTLVFPFRFVRRMSQNQNQSYFAITYSLILRQIDWCQKIQASTPFFPIILYNVTAWAVLSVKRQKNNMNMNFTKALVLCLFSITSVMSTGHEGPKRALSIGMTEHGEHKRYFTASSATSTGGSVSEAKGTNQQKFSTNDKNKNMAHKYETRARSFDLNAERKSSPSVHSNDPISKTIKKAHANQKRKANPFAKIVDASLRLSPEISFRKHETPVRKPLQRKPPTDLPAMRTNAFQGQRRVKRKPSKHQETKPFQEPSIFELVHAALIYCIQY